MWIHTALFVAVLSCLCSGVRSQALIPSSFVDGIQPRCVAGPSNSLNATYYEPTLRGCLACPSGSYYATALGRCRCNPSYIELRDPNTNALSCQTCPAGSIPAITTSLLGSATCLPCNGNATMWLTILEFINATMPNATLTVTNTTTIVTTTGVNDTTMATTTTTAAPTPAPSNATIVEYDQASLQAVLIWNQLNATLKAPTATCGCPAGFGLIDNIGGVPLKGFLCRKCAQGLVTTAAANGYPTCIAPCPSPFTMNNATGVCGCATGELQVDGSHNCISAQRVASIASLSSSNGYTLTPKNINNDDSIPTSPSAVRSFPIQEWWLPAAVGCANANMTSCNALANLCVLTFYDLGSPPCQAYQRLLQLENCRGNGCEVPSTLPWLYYLRSSPETLYRNDIAMQLALQPTLGLSNRIKFVISSFSLDGKFLGNRVVTDDLHTCDIEASVAREFYVVGTRRVVNCFLNLRWYMFAPSTTINELYIYDAADGTLKDVPVLIDNTPTTMDPIDFDDPVLYRAAASGDSPAANGLRRRFFMYDNMGGREGSLSSPPKFVTFARRVTIMFSLRLNHDSRIFKPLVIIQYASALTADMITDTALTSGEILKLRTNQTSGKFTMGSTVKSTFVQQSGESVYALRTTLITLCCLCLLSALARTYGWMRRQQDMILGLPTLIRFCIHYLNHLSNVFAITIVIACWAFYLLFKQQSAVEYVLPQQTTYLFPMLFTATASKAVYIIYKIVEQVNADIFVIDWERSKGTMHGGKEIPVSMWRSTFLSNEFNELQIFQRFRALLVMLIVICFLEGGHYIDASKTVPDGTTHTTAAAVNDPILRVAVESMFWIVVAAVLYILEFEIYYRFVAPHPLTCFVDLCSVSNVSIMILLEPNWGFYIHGESIHPFADASMEEFQENLKRESQNNLPPRGLGGVATCQTFEIFAGIQLRQFINIAYGFLYASNGPPQVNALPPVPGTKPKTTTDGAEGAGGHVNLNTAGGGSTPAAGSSVGGGGGGPQQGAPMSHPLALAYMTPQLHFFDFISPHQSLKQNIFSGEMMAIKSKLNEAMQASVRSGEQSILAKFGLHSLADFPPNILYMNGAFSGDRAGMDLYFIDEGTHWGTSLLMALDFDLFVLYVCFFLSVDYSVQNTFISITLTYLLHLAIVFYRQAEGQANLAKKLIFDDRFFL